MFSIDVVLSEFVDLSCFMHLSLARQSRPDVPDVRRQEPLGGPEQFGMRRRLEVGGGGGGLRASRAVRHAVRPVADAFVQVLRHAAQECLSVHLMQVVAKRCGAVSDIAGTERGDHGPVGRVLIGEDDGDARGRPRAAG